jgi:hypothetical protein
MSSLRDKNSLSFERTINFLVIPKLLIETFVAFLSEVIIYKKYK